MKSPGPGLYQGSVCVVSNKKEETKMSGQLFVVRDDIQVVENAVDRILNAIEGMDAEDAHRAIFIAKQYIPHVDYENTDTGEFEEVAA